jgi:hypothetical protein
MSDQLTVIFRDVYQHTKFTYTMESSTAQYSDIPSPPRMFPLKILDLYLRQSRKLFMRSGFLLVPLIAVVLHPQTSANRNNSPYRSTPHIDAVTDVVERGVSRKVRPSCNETANIAKHSCQTLAYAETRQR